MKHRRRPASSVAVGRDALATIRAASSARLPRETGGILIGWIDGDVIRVDRALEVFDPNATGNGYERNREAAQDALDDVLAGEPSDSPIGYVGEWHSHPADVGPSSMDLSSIMSIASSLKKPAVLLVASRIDDEWKVTGVVRARWRYHARTVTMEQQ